MSETSFPDLFDSQQIIHVRCSETRVLSDHETACLVDQVEGEAVVAIVSPEYCDTVGMTIKGRWLETMGQGNILVDLLSSGRRALISQDQVVSNGNSS